jgi:glucose/mannose transport system permease protein
MTFNFKQGMGIVPSGLAAVPVALVLTLFYVFVAWTFVISLTASRLLPNYEFVGFDQYRRLFSNPRWWEAAQNLAVYSMSLICGCVLLGYSLAILIDRGVRRKAVFCTIFMVPLSLSFVVAGIIWLWLLNPGLGIEHAVRELGWSAFAFNWLVRSDRAIYTVAIAGIWQQTGMCMALFLAGMREIDPNVWRVATLDAVPAWRFYLRIITPALRTTFFTATVLLCSMAVKSFELVATLTGGGPGFSSDLPARFVIDLIGRQELGMGAAGACVLLCIVAAVIAPYVYVNLHRQRVA